MLTGGKRANRCVTMLCAVIGPCVGIGAEAPDHARPEAVVASHPLAAALAEFGMVTGLQVVYVSDEVRSVTTKGSPPGLAPEQTLTNLLSGTGLTFEFLNERTIRVYLKPVSVQKQQGATSSGEPGKNGVAPQTASGNSNLTVQGEQVTSRKNLLSRLFSAFVACGAVPATGTPCAQNAATEPHSTPDITQLKEVIVTAEKRQQNVQKTAVAIQVFDGDSLKIEGKKRINDIVETVAGIQLQDGTEGISYSFRGVDSGTTGQTQPGATVAVLEDGIYQDRPETLRAATLDLARTEVMWGTQSTTLGPSSIAGAISLVSNKPVLKEYRANGSVEIGNYDVLNTEAMLNLPLTNAQSIRVAYGTSRRDGYYSSNAGAENDVSVRLRYRYQPSDSLDVVLTAFHNDVDGNGITYASDPAQGTWEGYNVLRDARMSANTCAGAGQPTCYLTTMGGPSPILGLAPAAFWNLRSDPWNTGYPKNLWPIEPYRDSTIDQYSAELTWKTPVGTVTMLPSYENTTYHSVAMLRGFGTNTVKVDAPTNSEQFEARLASNPGSHLQWLSGFYFYHTGDEFNTVSAANGGTTTRILLASDQRGGNANSPPTRYRCPYDASQLQNPGQPYDANTNKAVNGRKNAGGVVIPNNNCYVYMNRGLNAHTTESVFGNVIVPIGNVVRLIGGLRYSHDKREGYSNNSQANATGFGGVLGDAIGPLSPYAYGPRVTGSWSAVTYRAGFEYDIRPQALLYATWATGYQPGTIDINNPDTASVKNVNDQLTAGLKSRFFNQKLQFNIEAFLLNFKDRPFNDSLFVGDISVFDNDGLRPHVAADLSALDPNDTTVVEPRQVSKGADIDIAFLATPSDRINLTAEYLSATYGSPPVSPYYTTAQILANAGVSEGLLPNGITNPSAAQTAAAVALNAKYRALIDFYTGVVLQDSPKYSANISYSHQFRFGGGSTLTPRLSAFYKGAYWMQGNGTSLDPWGASTALNKDSPLRQNAYSLYNAYLTWQSADGKFTVGGYVRNIGNKAAMTNIGNDGGTGVAYVSLSAPRTFGITINATL